MSFSFQFQRNATRHESKQLEMSDKAELTSKGKSKNKTVIFPDCAVFCRDKNSLKKEREKTNVHSR